MTGMRGSSRVFIYTSGDPDGRSEAATVEHERRRLLNFHGAMVEPRTGLEVLRAAKTAKALSILTARAYVDPQSRKLTVEDWGHVALSILAGLADGAIGKANDLSKERVRWMREHLRRALGIRGKKACGAMAKGMGGEGGRK